MRHADSECRTLPDPAANPQTASTGLVGSPRGVAVIVGVVIAALVAAATRYGYHRDELYFLASGHHLAWSYPDQGPLTPLLARIMDAAAPGSLTLLRLPSALAAGGTVLLTSMLAREFGAGRRAQTIAAVVAAVAVIVLFTGHTLSTATFDLLAWAAVTWLAARAVRTSNDRLWLLVATVLGIDLLNKPLPVFLGVAILAGIAVAGPRRLLRSRYLWLAAGIAIMLWSPWLIWQATHGWPQLAVSRSIASGGSTSSTPRWQIVPFQVLMAGPLLAPVWIIGLVRLVRDPTLRYARFLAVTWVLLAVMFTATGGKPYYLAGLLPALIAAGAPPVDAWLDNGRRRTRRAVLGTALAISAVAGTLIALPVLPARDAAPIVAVNPDVGETIGWPDLVRAVAEVRHQLPRTTHPVILTSNYGEAGAIDRYGLAMGLPHAYSGHNAFGTWGPPPAATGPVIAVGFEQTWLTAHLRGCATKARINNTAGIDNDEHGAPVLICQGPRGSWAQQWPDLQHLD